MLLSADDIVLRDAALTTRLRKLSVAAQRKVRR
jgi:hypothetical protein